jgi:hypothetical protein
MLHNTGISNAEQGIAGNASPRLFARQPGRSMQCNCGNFRGVHAGGTFEGNDAAGLGQLV